MYPQKLLAAHEQAIAAVDIISTSYPWIFIGPGMYLLPHP
jgi:hypothetical protein